MKLKAVCFLPLFYLFATQTFAAPAGCAGKSCQRVYVDSIYLQGTGSSLIGTSGDEKLLNCTAASDKYLTLDLSENNSALMYNTLSAAQLDGKKISVRIVENSKNCRIKNIIVTR